MNLKGYVYEASTRVIYGTMAKVITFLVSHTQRGTKISRRILYGGGSFLGGGDQNRYDLPSY